MRQHRPQSDIRHYLVDAGVVVSKGDLAWFDGTYATKASLQADQSSLAANQAYFAIRFLGVFMGDTTGDETADTPVPVLIRGQVTFDIASTALKVEDYIGAVEAASGTALEDRKVAKVTDDAYAIGRVTSLNGTLTQVEFEIDPSRRERIANIS